MNLHDFPAQERVPKAEVGKRLEMLVQHFMVAHDLGEIERLDQPGPNENADASLYSALRNCHKALHCEVMA